MEYKTTTNKCIWRFEKCHGNIEKKVVDHIDKARIEAPSGELATELLIDDCAYVFTEYSREDFDAIIGNNYYAYEV